ncbi:MAG: hypothetical protein ABIR04_08160, partial [Cypionkella sp.]
CICTAITMSSRLATIGPAIRLAANWKAARSVSKVKQEITEQLARVKAQRPMFSHEIKGLFMVQSVMTDRYARRAVYEGQR